MASLNHENGVENSSATVNGTTNGTTLVNGRHWRRPETPTGRMSLTEYSANPSTPPGENRARLSEVVPKDFLLPDGYPDVSTPFAGFMW